MQQTLTVGDTVLLVPDGVNVLNTPACSYESSSFSFQFGFEFQARLAEQVGVEFGFNASILNITLLQAAFSAAEQAQVLFGAEAAVDLAFVGSVAECTAYEAVIAGDSGVQLQLSQEFQNDVATLTAGSNYLQFIEKYGTNYVRYMKTGENRN